VVGWSAHWGNGRGGGGTGRRGRVGVERAIFTDVKTHRSEQKAPHSNTTNKQRGGAHTRRKGGSRDFTWRRISLDDLLEVHCNTTRNAPTFKRIFRQFEEALPCDFLLLEDGSLFLSKVFNLLLVTQPSDELVSRHLLHDCNASNRRQTRKSDTQTDSKKTHHLSWSLGQGWAPAPP
jgi:hypothetical protein